MAWTSPIKVNKTSTNIPIGNQQAFRSSVDVSANGTVSVTHYDFRSNTGAASLRTEYFIVHCHPVSSTTCTNPANWIPEQTLTAAPFDMRTAPNAGEFFTGDYEGLANAGNDFTPFFSQPHGSDPSRTFFDVPPADRVGTGGAHRAPAS